MSLGNGWDPNQCGCHCTRSHNSSWFNVFKGSFLNIRNVNILTFYNFSYTISTMILDYFSYHVLGALHPELFSFLTHDLLASQSLQTESSLLVSRLSIPCTHFDLQYVRPDFIMLRIIARNLIMWNRYNTFILS